MKKVKLKDKNAEKLRIFLQKIEEIKKERRCIQINYVSFKTDWPVEK